MIRISTSREPVTVALTGPYVGVTLTLKRLTTADYSEARQAAQAIVQDESKLLPLLVEHDLLPDGKVKAWKGLKTSDPMRYAAFISGVATWVSAVECGVMGITGWTGVADEAGSPAIVSREALEVLMLDDTFSGQAMAQLDQAARIIASEGKP